MPRKPPTPEQRIKAIDLGVKRLLKKPREKSGEIRLSSAQAKLIWQCMHTVTLYLEQPEKIRKTQVQKIFEARTALEMEYKEQTGKEIDK